MTQYLINMISKSERQTVQYGKQLAKQLQGGEVIALIGELGAGKTTLIKGIAQGLGLKQIITSPTFLLMRVYPVTKTGKIKNLVHIDAYRIKKPQELEAIGALEYFGRDDTVVLIEWADKIKKLLPPNIKTIKLTLGQKETSRKITTSP